MDISFSSVNLNLKLCQTYWKRDGLWSLIISCTLIYKRITREIIENYWKEKMLKGKNNEILFIWYIARQGTPIDEAYLSKYFLLIVLIEMFHVLGTWKWITVAPSSSSFLSLSNGRHGPSPVRPNFPWAGSLVACETFHSTKSLGLNLLSFTLWLWYFAIFYWYRVILRAASSLTSGKQFKLSLSSSLFDHSS